MLLPRYLIRRSYCWRSYENNNVGNMAWAILKVSPEMAELILARFLEWVLKVMDLTVFSSALFLPHAATPSPRDRF